MYTQRIEAHPWFEAGSCLDGSRAEQRLRQNLSEHTARSRCVYIHVPFCENICSFCGLYTKAVSKNKQEVFAEYLEHVIPAIQTHPYARQGAIPTTVHFGGGTPLQIGMERFELLCLALREGFGNCEQCEWALETTTSDMNDAAMAMLQHLNFRRIHLGIQTLDDGIRQTIGRRETGRQCLDKIDALNARGFLSSVDLIIGFDNMNEKAVENDLHSLYDAGIRMFSICELRLRSRREWTKYHTPVRLQQNRRLWQRIWAFMREHDLSPIHLGQFGRDYSDNLYFTHPARGEDCIAIGPYAHGSSGNLYYSNKLLPDYYTAVAKGLPTIDHGVFYPPEIQVIRRLESELLAHTIKLKSVLEVATVYGQVAHALWDAWMRHGYIVKHGDQGFVLSCDGSWFIGNMIMHLRELPVSGHLPLQAWPT